MGFNLGFKGLIMRGEKLSPPIQLYDVVSNSWERDQIGQTGGLWIFKKRCL